MMDSASSPDRGVHPQNGKSNLVLTKNIEHTDFPLDEIALHFANNVHPRMAWSSGHRPARRS
jgi:hypothetical protein